MEDEAVDFIKDNPLDDEMCIKQGYDTWEQFGLDKLGDTNLPTDPKNLYNVIIQSQDLSRIALVLDISQWLSKDPMATRKATYHSHLQ